jgi:hypothetical protein
MSNSDRNVSPENNHVFRSMCKIWTTLSMAGCLYVYRFRELSELVTITLKWTFISSSHDMTSKDSKTAKVILPEFRLESERSPIMGIGPLFHFVWLFHNLLDHRIKSMTSDQVEDSINSMTSIHQVHEFRSEAPPSLEFRSDVFFWLFHNPLGHRSQRVITILMESELSVTDVCYLVVGRANSDSGISWDRCGWRTISLWMTRSVRNYTIVMTSDATRVIFMSVLSGPSSFSSCAASYFCTSSEWLQNAASSTDNHVIPVSSRESCSSVNSNSFCRKCWMMTLKPILPFSQSHQFRTWHYLLCRQLALESFKHRYMWIKCLLSNSEQFHSNVSLTALQEFFLLLHQQFK